MKPVIDKVVPGLEVIAYRGRPVEFGVEAHGADPYQALLTQEVANLAGETSSVQFRITVTDPISHKVIVDSDPSGGISVRPIPDKPGFFTFLAPA